MKTIPVKNLQWWYTLSGEDQKKVFDYFKDKGNLPVEEKIANLHWIGIVTRGIRDNSLEFLKSLI